MRIIYDNAEVIMLDLVKRLRGTSAPHFAIYFNLSKLHPDLKNDFQMRIAINILNDLFRDESGIICPMQDADIALIYNGADSELVEQAVFQLRYLFIDDRLANHKDGSENSDFCDVYDLGVQWRQFHKICVERAAQARKKHEVQEVKEMADSDKLTPVKLSHIINELDDIELEQAMRSQPICAIQPNSQVRPVFNETYVNMKHLQKILVTNCSITSDKWLFYALTKELDKYLMHYMVEYSDQFFEKSVSINLNVETVLSEHFSIFLSNLAEKGIKQSIVVEIQVPDVFSNMDDFLRARDIVHENGCRLCIDGLDNESFIQVDRNQLGFDLAKLRWNADVKGDLALEKNDMLKDAVKKCGSNRIILCRCDDQHAIEYGHELGITLFQGRHADRILSPNALVVN